MFRDFRQCMKTGKPLDKFIFIAGLLVITVSIITSIYMLFINRNLWLDEAMFAYSFNKRNLLNLVATPFEWTQTAPVIYIYLCKLLTLIFGNSEIVLRLPSLLAYIALIYFTYYTSSKIFKIKHPILPAAFVSTISILLRYSNEFKVYELDTVCVLLTLVFYHLFKQKKISLKVLTLLFIIMLLTSNPTVFFIGGIYIYELISALRAKYQAHKTKSEDKPINQQILHYITSGAVVLAAFAVYYFLYLRNMATDDNMVNFWVNHKFPLIPTHLSDFAKAKDFLGSLFQEFKTSALFIAITFAISMLYGLIKKNRYVLIITFSLILALFASQIGKYPFISRLWLFSLPLIVIMVFYLISQFFTSDKLKNTALATFCFAIIGIGVYNGPFFYQTPDHVYLKGEEVSGLIDYISDNVQPDEDIYVYYHAIPYLHYKLGYDITDIHGSDIIYGSGFYEDQDFSADAEKIAKTDKAYLLFAHPKPDRVNQILPPLAESGYLELIKLNHNTPLYYYSQHASDAKTNFKYSVSNLTSKDNTYQLDFNLTNTGGSILNHSYETLTICDEKHHTISENLPKNISQSDSITIPLTLDFSHRDKYQLQLCNSNGYDYQKFHIAPLTVKKTDFKKENQ